MLSVGFLDILTAVLLYFLIIHSNILMNVNAHSFIILLIFRVVFKVKPISSSLLSKEKASLSLTVQLFAIKVSAGWQIFLDYCCGSIFIAAYYFSKKLFNCCCLLSLYNAADIR